MDAMIYTLVAVIFAAGVAAGWAVYGLYVDTVDQIVARTDARRRVLA